MSQWYTNVNKTRPRHAPTCRKTFKWTHFMTISKREWISTVIVYVYEVIWSIYFHSIKLNYDNRIGESPWRSWCYLICIITRGLCFYNARLCNDDVTAIGVSYWRRREFPNYERLNRGRMCVYILSCLRACIQVFTYLCICMYGCMYFHVCFCILQMNVLQRCTLQMCITHVYISIYHSRSIDVFLTFFWIP